MIWTLPAVLTCSVDVDMSEEYIKTTSDKLDVNVSCDTIRTSLPNQNCSLITETSWHSVGERECSNVWVGGENNISCWRRKPPTALSLHNVQSWCLHSPTNSAAIGSNARCKVMRSRPIDHQNRSHFNTKMFLNRSRRSRLNSPEKCVIFHI